MTEAQKNDLKKIEGMLDQLLLEIQKDGIKTFYKSYVMTRFIRMLVRDIK